MKKILIFINFFGTKSESFITDEIAFLSKQDNIQVDILQYGEPVYDKNIDGLSFPTPFWKRWLNAPGKTTLRFWRSLKYRNGWNGILAYLIHFFQERNYDVIYAHFGPNGKLIAELQNMNVIPSSTRLVVRFHGMDMSFFKYPVGYYDIVVKRFVDVIAGSDFAVKDLHTYGFLSSQIWKLPVGVQEANISEPTRFHCIPENFHVVSIGRLVELKGHIQAIFIMRELMLREVNFKFTIVGKGPLRKVLDELIFDFGLSKQVNIIDGIEHQNVLDLLKNSHLYLYPGIVDRTGRQETQGLANLEAMANGLLVLASEIGGVTDYIKPNETGYLCEPGNINGFVEKIQWIIAHYNSSEVFRIRINALQKVRTEYCQESLNVKLLHLLMS